MLEDNINQIKTTVSQACQKVQHKTDSVKVIAVTKSVTSEEAEKLIPFGFTDFGENRTDHLLEKQAALKDYDITWHLIGRLQRRKVKDVINQVDYFHALENERLAAEIEKRAEHVIKCFVQVNVSQEEAKQGVLLDETNDFIEALAKYPLIEVVGLMTMAPFDGTETEIEEYFTQLAIKRDEIMALNWEHAPCKELSMGMTQDFEIAIKAGATHVRIGTAFFKD